MSDSEFIQEYLANLPEGQDFGFQTLGVNGWEDDWEIIYYRRHSISVPKMISYDQAAEEYRTAETTCRVVKYARYLANGEICVHLVKRYKEAQQ